MLATGFYLKYKIMKKTTLLSFVAIALLFLSCSSKVTLQEYFVNNNQNPNFLALDVPASILNINVLELTPLQQETVKSFKKINVLAFKKTAENTLEFEAEKVKLTQILKGQDFTELMKFSVTGYNGVVKYIGNEDAIDEIILFGSGNNEGFAIARILGDNMNPANIIQFIQAMEKSNVDMASLKQFSGLLGN